MADAPVINSPQPTTEQPYQPPVGTGPVESPIAGGPVSTPPPPSSPQPATAPASTLAPSKTSGLHGVLANVALGALAGAVSGIKKTTAAAGRGYDSYINRTPYGQKVQTNRLEMQAKQQKMQQEQVAAMDEHQVKQLAIQDANLDHLHKIAENRHIENMYSGAEEEQRNTLITQHRAQDDVDRKFLTQLEETGIHIDPKHFSEFTPGDGANVGNGTHSVVNNGKTGEEAGGGFINNQELENTILPHDFSVVSDWKMDKDGTMTPTYTTLKAGQNSAMDALIAHDAGMDKFNQLQGMYQTQLKSQEAAANVQKAEQEPGLVKAQAGQAKAAAAKDYASAALTKAQTDSLKTLGVVVPAGYNPPPTVFSMTPQQVQQELETNKVNVPGNFASLYGAAHYKIDPKTFPSRPYNRPGMPPQMGKDQALSFIRTFINPNYDEKNYQAVQKMEDEFASTKPNTAGGNLVAFNTATGHLGQLYQASQLLQNNNLLKLNEMANELGVQTGHSPRLVFDAIKTALVGELGKTFKSAAPDVPEMDAIAKTLLSSQSPQDTADLTKTYAHLMLTKAGAQVAHFYAYTGELPAQTVDPNAEKVYQSMGINPSSVLPSGNVPIGATGNTTQTPQVPTGKIPAYSKSTGAIIGYADDANGTNFVKF